MARFGVGRWVGRWLGAGAFPLATLLVNIVGGLLMGLLAGWLAFRGGAQGETIRLFAAVGVLGGFTTFSAFSLEAVMLAERGALGTAAAYVAVSLAAGFTGLFAGLYIVRSFA